MKTQHVHALMLRTCLDSHDRDLVAGHREIGERSRALEPMLTTRYVRSTLLLDGEGARVTLDRQVTGVAPDGRCATLLIVEAKSIGAPGIADRYLWRAGHRPVRVSKFGTSLAALFPDLPSSPWTRALGQPWRVHDAADRPMVALVP